MFVWEDGHSYEPNYLSRVFSREAKKFGRPEITLHKLRHTCVSLLAEMGWDLKKIQYWCGHKDFSTTANIYMHFNRERLNQSADDLAKMSEDVNDLFEDAEPISGPVPGTGSGRRNKSRNSARVTQIQDYDLLRSMAKNG